MLPAEYTYRSISTYLWTHTWLTHTHTGTHSHICTHTDKQAQTRMYTHIDRHPHTCISHAHSTLTSSLTTGNNAVGAIIDFMTTISTIEEALNITNAINATIQQLRESINDLMVDSLEDEANDLLENSRNYQSEASNILKTVANLSLAIFNAKNQVDSDRNETNRIYFKVRDSRHLVNGLQIAAGMFSSDVSQTLNYIDTKLTTIDNNYLFISTIVPDLLTDVVESLALVNETQNVSD